MNYETMKQQNAERVRLIERLQKLGYWFSREEVKDERANEERENELRAEGWEITHTPSGNAKVMHNCFIDIMDVTEYLRDFEKNYIDQWAIKAAHSILDSLRDDEGTSIPYDMPFALRGFFFIDHMNK